MQLALPSCKERTDRTLKAALLTAELTVYAAGSIVLIVTPIIAAITFIFGINSQRNTASKVIGGSLLAACFLCYCFTCIAVPFLGTISNKTTANDGLSNYATFVNTIRKIMFFVPIQIIKIALLCCFFSRNLILDCLSCYCLKPATAHDDNDAGYGAMSDEETGCILPDKSETRGRSIRPTSWAAMQAVSTRIDSWMTADFETALSGDSDDENSDDSDGPSSPLDVDSEGMLTIPL